ncbi:MAG: hypothetical protein LKE89_07110 [Lactobacillaceae bacterium]|jgi:hypothetical protein|nr:hypothetical protein [Lactobacillaceae bacterium]
MTATFIWKQVFTNYPQLHYPLLPQQITKYYCNLTGNYLQVRLNNQANEDALIIHELMISRYPDCQIAQTLTFQNQPHFQVAGGQSLWTDAAEFPVTAGETYYLSLKATNISGTINSLGYAPAHLIYQQLTAPPNSSLKDYYYGIDALRCQSTDPAVLVSFFGDSIIGQGYLSENISRLFYHHWPQKITTCNAGIFGNRLLHSGQIMSQNPTSFSQAGNQRFNPDVLYD